MDINNQKSDIARIKEKLSLVVDIGTNGEVSIGNKKGLLCCSAAAGSGAILSLLSSKAHKFCNEIKKRTCYIELSSSNEFNDEFIKNMYF